VETSSERERGLKHSPETQNALGVVFNIQRFSLHDGPGIRTVVFLKGCPMSCKWCCNPESIQLSPQIVFNAEKCLRDGRCLEVCTTGARNREGYRPEKCTFCGMCVEACPTGALELLGKKMSISEIIQEVEKDHLFYETSGGGVTLSGGELLAQYTFSVALLEELKRCSIHTAIETSGYGPWSHLKQIVDACDLVLYDLKHMNSESHMRYTGVPNELILENALKITDRIAGTKKDMIIRVPLIGGVNTDRENIDAIACFALKAGVMEVHLLPYHRLGESKYRKLGMDYPHEAFILDDGLVNTIKDILETHGLIIRIGG